MAEVRLGSNENMKNINLGSIEIQEVYLGNILVWQNNQAPIYLSLSWDGTSFVVPTPFEALTGTSSSNIADGGNNITLTIGGLSDPDNIDPLTDDFLVGYRLQRPDGTYAAGDPASVANRADGAPVAEFGDVLPGTASLWDAVEEEFTAGSETLGTSNITVALRETDSDGNIVDSLTQEFVDDGNWILIVIDSRGGESEMATMDITLNYADANGAVESSITQGGVAAGTNISVTAGSPTSFQNVTIGGPANAVLAVESTGGPLSTTATDIYEWSCISGCTGTGTGATFSVAIPQAAGGDATPARVRATLTGRAWNTNAAVTTTLTDVYFRSGASCSPSISVGSTNFSFVADTDPAVCLGAESPATFSVSCSGVCTGFSYTSGTNFSAPSPGCSGFNTLETATVSVSGSTTGAIPGIGVGGSRGYSGSYPQVGGNACTVSVSCSGAPVAFRNAACGGTVSTTVNCNGTTCAGAPADTGNCNGAVLTGLQATSPNDWSGGAVAGSGSCNGGVASVSVNYSAITATWRVDCGATEVPAGTDPTAFSLGCTFVQTNSVTTGSLPTLQSRFASGSCDAPGDSFRVLQSCVIGSVSGTINGTSNGVNCAVPAEIECV